MWLALQARRPCGRRARTRCRPENPPARAALRRAAAATPGIAPLPLPTLPPGTPLSQLVRLAMLRWRIERDSLELKDQFGLDHYEGRGWRGFHHHGTLCIAAYAFLAARGPPPFPPPPPSLLPPPPPPP